MTAPVRIQPGGYRWNAQLARYIAPNGRIVSTVQVRAAIDQTLDEYTALARSLADQLRAGDISLRAWEAEMRVVVKDSQLLGSAAARGGWAQLDQRSLGRAGREIRDQYAFLDRFATDIMTGRQKLDGTLTNRALMYVEAARPMYEAEREAMEIEAGYDEERNVLHPADHCEGPSGCPAQTARGWVRSGTLVRIGRRPCRTRCKCTIERRKSEQNARRRTPNRPATRRQRERTLIGT